MTDRAAQAAPASDSQPAAGELPTGIVTFLFTDIEGSTQMLERHRAAAGAAFARHHELLREAIEANRGVVFETVGDAVYAAFSQPVDAVLASVAIVRALEAEDWGEIRELRARIAINTGSVEARGRHYFGPPLFECARLESLVHGGQILTSRATQSLAGDDLPDGVSLQPMGTHRLKDLETPMEVFQVHAPGLRDEFPPLRAATTAQTNLPTEATTFVGRAADLAAVSAFLDERAFVTLVGSGGTGKTRLAMEVAQRHLDDYADGAWIVELAPVSDPELVLGAVADIWNLRAGEGTTLDGVLLHYLSTRRLLLIIDNCEHVVDAAAALVDRIVKAGYATTLLVTSREPLGVPGETVYRVPSLGLPEADGGGDASTAESVLLFLDRARTVRPDLSMTPEDLEAVARICRRLDGMPLGLELAAARLRTLSPIDLADRLDDSFRILTGGARTAMPRQRTLQATIDWSHEMLSDAERTVFRRLSTFAGGFDIPAAEAVCAGGAVEEFDILDHVDSLLAKSLVMALPGPHSRFRLLEPIREYAQNALEASGEAAAVRLGHARHFAALVAEAAPHTRGAGQMPWDRRLDREYENVRVAFRTLREAGEFDAYLGMCFDLFLYWMHVGRHLEGIETCVAGLEAPGSDAADPLLRIKAWAVAAGLGAEITRPEAVEHARKGLAEATALGDPNAIGRMEIQLGAAIRHSTTDPEYLEHLVEGRRLVEEHPEPLWWEPTWERGFFNLVLAAYLPEEDERVREHFHAALKAFDEAGDEALLAATLSDSGGLWGQEDDAWVLGNVRRAVEIYERIEVPYWYGHTLQTQGALFILQSDYASAAAAFAKGAGMLEDCGDLACWATSSRYLADAEARIGRAHDARGRVASVIRRLPLLPMQEVAIPRTLDAAASVLTHAGPPEAAARVIGWSLANPLPVPTFLPRTRILEALRSEVVESLGQEEAERLMAEGAATPTADLVTSALAWLEAD